MTLMAFASLFVLNTQKVECLDPIGNGSTKKCLFYIVNRIKRQFTWGLLFESKSPAQH